MGWRDRVDFEELKGLVLTNIELVRDGEDEDSDIVEIVFTSSNGDRFKLYHAQDCCESVWVEDVCGELDDLIGSEILMAEMVSNEQNVTPEGLENPGYSDDSWTWTFYKLATVKGFVTIRWFGTSNGYYSEEVDFEKMN